MRATLSGRRLIDPDAVSQLATQAEVAAALGITQQRADQIEKMALEKIEEGMRSPLFDRLRPGGRATPMSADHLYELRHWQQMERFYRHREPEIAAKIRAELTDLRKRIESL